MLNKELLFHNNSLNIIFAETRKVVCTLNYKEITMPVSHIKDYSYADHAQPRGCS